MNGRTQAGSTVGDRHMSMRASIPGLMGVVALVALGMAALRANSELLTAAVLAGTVCALCSITLIALYRRGAWAGFAVFGWAQFWICQPYAAPPLGPTSLTMGLVSRLAIYAHAPTNLAIPSFRIGGYPAIASNPDGEPMVIIVAGTSTRGSVYLPVHSLRAALCLMSLAVGVMGSIVGGFLDRHYREQDHPGGGSQADVTSDNSRSPPPPE